MSLSTVFCNRSMRPWAAILWLIVPLSFAQATPNSSIVTSDMIVGTTSSSHFVIRTTTLRPPNYYAYNKRVELVQISTASGQIEEQCRVRETAFVFDQDAAVETWNQTELETQGCEIFQTLSQSKANYIEPTSAEPFYYKFQLDADGISASGLYASDPDKLHPILALANIRSRAEKTTQIVTVGLPWPVDEDFGDSFSVFSQYEDFDIGPELCKLGSDVATSMRGKWIFLRLVCWPGDDDVDGANFYVPVNLEKLEALIQ